MKIKLTALLLHAGYCCGQLTGEEKSNGLMTVPNSPRRKFDYKKNKIIQFPSI